MASGREKKKGWQARASSRTPVSKSAQKPTIKDSSDVERTMSADTENKKGVRIKPLPLKVDTQLAQEVYKVEPTGGGAGAGASNSKPARKANNDGVSKPSEAMMNKNWRNPRYRADCDSLVGDLDNIWSAPPEKPRFSSETTARPQRNDNNEVIDYERGLKRVAYRCRKPEDVRPELIPFTSAENVDAGLCLSAPATKLEFLDAELGGEERSEKYNPSVFQPAVKSVVRLDQMAPVKRAGYEKVLDWEENSNPNSRVQDSSSIAAIYTASPGNLDWEKIEFPFAVIRPVKGEQRFPTELNGVEKTLRKQLSELVVPQSAGLPPEYLRKEYETLREERLKAIDRLRLKIGTGTTLKEIPENVDQERAANDSSKDNRLNALLGKLNRLCAPRLRACTIDNSGNTGSAEDKDKENSPSGDSGVSGLSPKARKRASSLNPAAVEFHCPAQNQTTGATAATAATGCSPTSIPGLSGPAASVVSAAEYYASKDPIKLLETRVAELEALIARQESKKIHHGRQGWAGANNVVYMPPGLNGQVVTRPALYPEMNGGFHGQTAAALPPLQHFPVPQPQPQPQPQPGPPFGPGMQTGPVVTANHYLFNQAQNGMGMPGNGMAPHLHVPTAPRTMVPFQGNGFIGQPNTLQCQQPIAYRASHFNPQLNVPQVPIPPRPCEPAPAVATGGATETSRWVKSMFGPKPVAKPRGPFRPGDAVQARQQQQYEEYLEHLRATDPSYAMKCKQRQARRADRRRFGAPNEGLGTAAH